MAAPDQNSRLHVVMFPWLAFGHIIPFLDLAKIIAGRHGHRVSLITTPRNAARLPHVPPSITVVPIPLPTVPGLPEGAESTTEISGDTQMSLLKKAFDGLEPQLTRFLLDSDPDWIVSDFTPHWLPPITARLGISTAILLITNAIILTFLGSANDMVKGSDYRTRPEEYSVPPKWVGFETRVAYRRYEAEVISSSLSRPGESGFSDLYRLGKVMLGCDAIVPRHCREWEPDWLKALEEVNCRRVIPWGLMPPDVDDHNSSDDDDETWASIKTWLDRQDRGSVVYVAFGTEVVLTRDQLSELAHGLELSGVTFFWVLRISSWSLPDGFEERVKNGRGIVWRNWVPQLKILSHDSIGGFLTHCGWGSTVEGLMFGRPLITLPFLLDQGLNSRMVVQSELGLEVSRNEDDGSYTKESLAHSIKVVMTEERGRKLRETARQMSNMISDRELHNKYIDELVEFFEDHRRKVKKKKGTCNN